MKTFIPIAIVLGLAAAGGCGESKPKPVDPQAPSSVAARDPLMQQIESLPHDQRQAFADAHREEILQKGDAFKIQLYNLGVRVIPNPQ